MQRKSATNQPLFQIFLVLLPIFAEGIGFAVPFKGNLNDFIEGCKSEYLFRVPQIVMEEDDRLKLVISISKTLKRLN